MLAGRNVHPWTCLKILEMQIVNKKFICSFPSIFNDLWVNWNKKNSITETVIFMIFGIYCIYIITSYISWENRTDPTFWNTAILQRIDITNYVPNYQN